MKSAFFTLLAIACTGGAQAQNAAAAYTNFIRQVQMSSGVQWDASVAATGEGISSLPIDTGGSRFELWTVRSSPLTSYLLDTRFVSAYAPTAEVVIRSEDPYQVIPRTRADRPFQVDISLQGLLSGATDPEPSKAVKLLRHAQSYGVGGTGETLDRTQATLLSQAMITSNGKQTFSYVLNSIPNADRTKVCGEERFSVYSQADGSVPESQLASRYVQIWPVADGSIAGLTANERVRFKAPQLTMTLNELYPESRTYVQVYPGEPKLGVEGTIVPGTQLVISQTVPVSRVLVVKDYDAVFDKDGLWTMELVTVTPFGTDRLSHVTFTIDRTIKANGMFTTIE
jgi:hypothetical protein